MSGGEGRAFRRLLLAAPLVVFALLAVLLGWRLWRGGDPSIVPSALIGRKAPALVLPPLEGLKRPDGTPTPGLVPSLMGAGAPVVVNFWASWCGPCRIEHPQLMQLAREGRVRLLGVNYKDVPENARRFLGQLGDPFVAVGADRDGATAVNWGVYGVPETFIVDGAGIIRYRHVGPLTEEALRGAFGAALAKAAR
ncbi:DsbE family thiol:disulfide interchange protein [Camelimonas lactis]|uniref:Cytochrome c biogenesis protein CcmG/thiol:disulfide interchange protein DsbE n=1 Tax=Camelimonas lactis TaxID=659006 RepID=A0A4R2GWF7_9HYPH|nr:DsbE family thiol:disulfide interchange protein [Camelimonas lactis]TCO14614.1 cytochrome c biogenesis protein CcmG/thiol:disulfide interchange protein DsbE [Camelimonas lactis]